MWTDKRLVQLVSTSHYRTVVNSGRKGRRTSLEIKARYTVFQYNKFLMGIDIADKYLRYHSILRNTVKWPNLSAKLCIPQCNIVYKTINTSKKIKYKNFLQRLQGSRYQKFGIQMSPVLMNCTHQRSNQHKAKKVPPVRLYKDFSKHKLDKTVAGGE